MINGGIQVVAKGLMKFWMRSRSQSGDRLDPLCFPAVRPTKTMVEAFSRGKQCCTASWFL